MIRPNVKIENVVFDMDMTLCYPTKPFPEVFQSVFEVSFETLAYTWLEHVTIDGPCTGMEAVSACFPDMCDKLREQKYLDISNAWAKSQMLFDGVESFFEKLRNATGCRIGIMTNGPEKFQRDVIDAISLPSMVDYFYVSGDPKIGCRKPNRAVLKALEFLELCHPETSLFVGDSWEKDLKPAKSAGWMTLHTRPTNQPHPTMSIKELINRIDTEESVSLNWDCVS